jgi:photosystem II stability/assembly factor-like uncharacterized protein
MKKRWFVVGITIALSITALFVLLGSMKENRGRLSIPALAAAPNRGGEDSTATTMSVTAVDPSQAPNDIDRTIVIHGSNFTAAISGTVVITAPTVTLGDDVLPSVIWVNTTTMSATVPWGLTPNVYSMTVINSDGISITLQNAFTVTEGFGIFATGGPYGGSITEIRKKPGTPTTVYAMAWGVGVFMSENSGEMWEPIYSDDTLRGLAFDAQDADVVYYGGREQIARSMDGGATWEAFTQINPNQKSCWSATPASHPTNAGVVYAAIGMCSAVLPGDGGIFQSNNYGQSWISKTNGMTDTDVWSLAIDPTNPDILLAGTNNGNVYTSNNGGESWSLSTRLDGRVNALYLNPYESPQAWASVLTLDLLEVTLYSSTNLTDWSLVEIDSNPPPGSGFQWNLAFITDTIWASCGNTYTSTDKGATWTETTGNHIGGEVNVVEITPDNPQEIYFGNPYGVERSVDGGQSYQQINQGLAAHLPEALAASPSDLETVLVHTNVGQYRTFNGGEAWQELSIGAGAYPRGDFMAFDAYSSTRVYSGGGGESIFGIDISPDAGETWERITATLPAEYDGWYGDVFAVASHPSVPGQVFAGVTIAPPGSAWWLPDAISLIYTSDDYGQSWTHIGPTEPISTILDIAFDAVDPDLIYVATYGSGVWKSGDGGGTWQAASQPDDRIQIDQIAVHPTLSGHLVVATSNELNHPALYASQDAGETWAFLTDAVGTPLVYAPTYPPILYGTTFSPDYQGLMRSFDDGQTWEQVPAAPYPRHLATATDGQRVVLYIGSPGGLATQVGRQTFVTNADTGEFTIFGGGVYRLTTLLPTDWVYLPLVMSGHTP